MECLYCSCELTEIRLFCSAKCRRESNKCSLAGKMLLYEPMDYDYLDGKK